jgi:putative redox protein
MRMNALPGAAVTVCDTGRGLFQVEARISGHALIIDEPVASGGQGTGPDPYELIGAALGACTAMTLRLYAKRKGLPLERVRVEVRHARQQAREVFEKSLFLDGPLDDDQRAHLKEIAEHCPVHLTLAHSADLRTKLAARDSVPAAAAAQPGLHARCMQEVCAGT